ncbi:MAG: MORN repeat-containing protein [Burkholderiales bacterium]
MGTVPIYLLAFVGLVASAHAEGPCKVLDPELQGTYVGPCVNGLAEGQGSASGAAKYTGGFKAGRKDGRGVKTWPSGDRYEGDFVAGRKEGRGTYSWGRGPWEGERYEGEYRNDKRDGTGTYTWPTGDVYRGPWKEDRITGYATPMMLAQRKFAEEAMKAVGKKRQAVCREMPVGIASTEWIRGVVVGVSGDKVGVRVADPGHQQILQGAVLRPGDVVWDKPTDWTPCL